MRSPLSLLKSIGAPGSLLFLLAAILAGLAFILFWPRARRVARIWLASIFGVYGILGVPVVANAIAAWLPALPPQPALQDARPDTLIVLDGDNRRGRVRESKRIFDLIRPGKVWLLGNPWMYDALWRAGVTYDDISIDSGPPNTRAQMRWVADFFAAHPTARVVLVASRLQMPRVAALAAATRVPLLLAPSPIDDEPPVSGWRRWVPTYYALRVSRDAIYEHIALLYYRWKGWISNTSKFKVRTSKFERER